MPNMADIVVKNAANVDVTLTAVTASAGDSIPARWRIDSAIAPAFRPVFSLMCRPSVNGSKVRRVSGSVAYPYTVTEDGRVVTADTLRFSFEDIIPQEVPTGVVDDFVAIVANFVKAVLVAEVRAKQVAPT